MKERPIIFSALMVRANHAGRKRMTRRVVKLDRLKVRLRRNLTADYPLNLVHPNVKASQGEVLPATLNMAGAVSCITPGGELGLKPGEFDFLCPYAEGETLLAAAGGKQTWTILPHESSIWIRETWRIAAWRDGLCRVACDYKASPEETHTPWIVLEAQEWKERVAKIYAELRKINYPSQDGRYQWEHGKAPLKWHPSIHMPRWACRDVYTVTKVRLERLQAITREDAIAEGVNCAVELEGNPCVDCGSCADSDLTAPIRAQANPRASFAALWERLNGKKPGCSWAANPWVWVIEYNNPEMGRHA